MFNKKVHTDILTLFNAMIVDNAGDAVPNTSNLNDYGVITDFTPTNQQVSVLEEVCKPLEIRTLFGREERANLNMEDLLFKQVLHYIEVYGLNEPGLFDLEVNDNVVVKLRYVRGITIDELEQKVQALLYTNAPIDDSEVIENIIKEFNLSYDVNQIANNELRVRLFDAKQHVFSNGDDAVRYMVYLATGNTLLIKSQEVINAIKMHSFETDFFEKHDLVLAQVFNRHKRLILAAKKHTNKTAINKISRMSKTKHVPIVESISKKFVALALAGNTDASSLVKVKVRDKFKMLNLIEYKLQGNSIDAFIIRNGKIHLEQNRSVHDQRKLKDVREMILDSLKQDLIHLFDKKIVLDQNVDYGLPVSRKQTIGNLPYGTTVSVSEGEISSGIYWRNEWGASDLDLSTIDHNGRRTGWGSTTGYSESNPIVFSGDITSAPYGAMEFMTSSNESYGLFVNIYSGEIGSQFELVIGHGNKDRWITDVHAREKGTLTSRGNIIGFVDNNRFTVFQGRLNNNSWSENDKSKAVVARGTADFWTVGKLFDTIGVEYDVTKEQDEDCDFDLRYSTFSYDLLEELLLSAPAPKELTR